MWENLISLSAKVENLTMTKGHYFTFGKAEYFTILFSNLTNATRIAGVLHCIKFCSIRQKRSTPFEGASFLAHGRACTYRNAARMNAFTVAVRLGLLKGAALTWG